jgi:hypothetical protein
MRGPSERLASRLQEIRVEQFGEAGVGKLSAAMNLAAQTWEHYETGVVIPGWILLQFIELTDVDPHWLLTGEGKRYRIPSVKSSHRASRQRCTNETQAFHQKSFGGFGRAPLSDHHRAPCQNTLPELLIALIPVSTRYEFA